MNLRVLYICKEPITGNKDEYFISQGLLQRGCVVTVLSEERVKKRPEIVREVGEGQDLLLFHKWNDVITLSRFTDSFPRCVVACWYFDLVDCDDTTLSYRCKSRIRYLRSIENECSFIFCTDGDWVFRNRSIYQVLRQGLGHHEVIPKRGDVKKDIPILFTGISKGGGILRESFVSLLKRKYGRDFYHVENGVHGPNLTDLINRSKVVVCPDYPVTGHYWSNRVYHMTGNGGCTLHPESKGLRLEFTDKQLVYYRNRDHLLERIDYYLDPNHEEERDRIAINGAIQTREHYLYQHRVDELLSRIKPHLNPLR